MSRQYLNEAKDAQAAINLCYAIVGMLENGTVRGWSPTAEKIKAMCKKEALRQLAKMDKAEAALGLPAPRARS